MRVILFAFTLILFGACGTTETSHGNPSESDVEVKYSYVKGEKDGSKAKLGVKGMACEVMCGGLIKKSLKKLEGVTTAAVSFDPENSEGLAEVDFDSKKITEKDLVAAIEKLNDGQYKVHSLEIVVTETSFEKLDDDATEIKSAESNMLDKKIALPNFPHIFGIIQKAIFRI